MVRLEESGADFRDCCGLLGEGVGDAELLLSSIGVSSLEGMSSSAAAWEFPVRTITSSERPLAKR